jgi:ATP-dependent Clp protease adaptor protein ClpS
MFGNRRPKSSLLERKAVSPYPPFMPDTAEPLVLPDLEQENQAKPKDALEPGWLVICWNDPVNLMAYVTHVFMVVFGWPKTKAEHHMLQVHRQGKSLLARENMERAEFYVHQLQGYKLHATMERDES